MMLYGSAYGLLQLESHNGVGIHSLAVVEFLLLWLGGRVVRVVDL